MPVGITWFSQALDMGETTISLALTLVLYSIVGGIAEPSQNNSQVIVYVISNANTALRKATISVKISIYKGGKLVRYFYGHALVRVASDLNQYMVITFLVYVAFCFLGWTRIPPPARYVCPFCEQYFFPTIVDNFVHCILAANTYFALYNTR